MITKQLGFQLFAADLAGQPGMFGKKATGLFI